MNEEYTLDQLRKMNQLDGSKKLIFVEQHNKMIQDLLTKVEMCIVKPYEGMLESENQCCIELHRKMTDDLRDWFNKLKNSSLSNEKELSKEEK